MQDTENEHVNEIVNFTAGPFIAKRNLTAEITIMISYLYISHGEHYDVENNDDGGVSNSGIVQTLQTNMLQFIVDLLALGENVTTLEHDFRETITIL